MLLKTQFLVYGPWRRLGTVRVPGWSEHINNLPLTLTLPPSFCSFFKLFLLTLLGLYVKAHTQTDGSLQPRRQFKIDPNWLFLSSSCKRVCVLMCVCVLADAVTCHSSPRVTPESPDALLTVKSDTTLKKDRQRERDWKGVSVCVCVCCINNFIRQHLIHFNRFPSASVKV